jgi:hypothetical protein
LAGGTCLEQLELRRQDIGYANALGARRIQDPTTAGDFCRRFTSWHAQGLMEVINETRLEDWARQPHKFFDAARIDADGTMVETYGECKKQIPAQIITTGRRLIFRLLSWNPWESVLFPFLDSLKRPLR